MPSSSNLRWPLPLGAALVLGAVTLAVGMERAPTEGAAVHAASTSAASGAGTGNSGNGVGNGPGSAAPPAKALVLHTDVLGAVRPGSPAQLRVRVENPNSQAVHLRTLTASVTRVTSAAGTGPVCAVGDFSITSFSAAPGTRRVLKSGSTTVELVITLRDTAADQDRCKGALYTFDARATADQA